MSRHTNTAQKKPKSLLNYIENSGGFIDRDAAVIIENTQPQPELPMLSIATADVGQDLEITPEVVLLESEISQQSLPVETPMMESQDNDNIKDKLQESIDALQAVLAEQQRNQLGLADLIARLVDSLEHQNRSIDQRFEEVNSVLKSTSQTLLETTEKLSAIATREITVPAPVVNVSLPEQKRIIKTVDRDSNGLIRQITEETEQTTHK
jgi:hypothetical protein